MVVNAYKVCETVTGTYFLIIIIIAIITITEMAYTYLYPFINSVLSGKALKIMFLFCFDFKKPRVKFWENFSNFYGMRVYNLCLNFLLISTFKVHLNFFWLCFYVYIFQFYQMYVATQILQIRWCDEQATYKEISKLFKLVLISKQHI